jgi:flagellar basal-body rod modification protein FlgD
MNAPIAATGLTDLNQTQKFASMGSEFNKIKEEDFFQLLTVELSSQDPLEPKKDSEFLSQVMQISSLEQARAMQADLAAMRMEQQVIQANAMLGRDVDFGGAVQGTVTSVKMEQGRPMIEVDGAVYDLQKLLSIALPENTSPAMEGYIQLNNPITKQEPQHA